MNCENKYIFFFGGIYEAYRCEKSEAAYQAVQDNFQDQQGRYDCRRVVHILLSGAAVIFLRLFSYSVILFGMGEFA